jgi:hypothetical protein
VSALPTGTNAIGSVTVSNFPAGGSEVSVSNFPATQPVSGTFWQTTQPVSGTVAISNFPPGGTEVSVSNFPASQVISGTVAISNFPAGGSEVTVVSALPTGANTIGAVKLVNQTEYENKVGNVWLACSSSGQLNVYSVSPAYGTFYGDSINIDNVATSLDMWIEGIQFTDPQTDGITFKMEISPDSFNWATLHSVSLNIKESPVQLRTAALNDIRTSAKFVRIVAYQAENNTGMSMVARAGVLWKQ